MNLHLNNGSPKFIFTGKRFINLDDFMRRVVNPMGTIIKDENGQLWFG